MSKKKDSTRIIKIVANSTVYGFNALVPENKAERVLKNILNNFKKLEEKYGSQAPLKVTTSVVNPTMF